MATGEFPTYGTEVVEADVLGAPCKIFAERPRHAGDLLLEGRCHPDAVYAVDGDHRITFERFEADVANMRDFLAASGVRPGDRVMVLGANSVEFLTTFWAALRSGAVAVLGNAWWSEREIAHGIASVGPRLVVCDERRQARLPEGTPSVLYSEVAAFGGARPMRQDVPPVPCDEDDPCLIIFTSGTTGTAKAAVLSHRAVIATLQSLLVITGRVPRGPVPMKPGNTSLLSVPLFHIGGLQQIINAMVTGARLVFLQGRFDPERVVRIIEEEDVRVWSTVPTMAMRVADHLQETGRSLDGLRTLGLGGSPVSEDMRARLRAAFPSARDRFGITWGLTEAGGVVTTGAGPEIERRPACVGRLLPTSEVRVDAPDEDGIGELLVRSPSVMLGYWTADGLEPGPVMPDRWLRTGDLGRVDDDGYVYVHGREKDVIIRGGENISSLAVEDVVCRHGSVAEAAVVGLPDRVYGEVVGAVVVVRPDAALSENELREFVAPHLAHFEIPAFWWIRTDALPRNAAGKVVKPALVAAFTERLSVSSS